MQKRILFTGGSSFTGVWFVRELCACGFEVVTIFQRDDVSAYEGVRRKRVEIVEGCSSSTVYGCSFGDDQFMSLLKDTSGGWDVLCHHGACVKDYRSAEFDVLHAAVENTKNIREVMRIAKESQRMRVVLTGSIFEQGEGAGSEGLPALSPYGLSKAITSEIFSYYADEAGVSLGKFVIPNPFGALEEPRFTNYLVKSWFAGEVPEVRTPRYVRDNIEVTLLAKAYARFVGGISLRNGCTRLNPSGYIESQGAFAQRFAREMEARLGIACPVKFAEQVEFAEPRIRVNTEMVDGRALGWDEVKAWNGIAEYYSQI